ncbi:hypothetical protein C8A00DRAFT_17418, partial [Chaetomidium leptoderma]
KGVQRIERLEVDEHVYHPHSDEAIGQAIQGLEIERFDWRKTDMAVTILHGMSSTRVLHLYSSGNDAVLRSWSAPDGLGKLQNVSV